MTRVRIVVSQQGQAELRRTVQERVTVPVTEGVARDMRIYVPVLTGALLSTVRTVFHPLEGQVWFGDVNRGIDYHLYQEYGTSRMAAQPYARPALYRTRSL